MLHLFIHSGLPFKLQIQTLARDQNISKPKNTDTSLVKWNCFARNKANTSSKWLVCWRTTNRWVEIQVVMWDTLFTYYELLKYQFSVTFANYAAHRIILYHLLRGSNRLLFMLHLPQGFSTHYV